MMITSPALELLGFEDCLFILGFCRVKVAHVALCDHGLDGALENLLQTAWEVDFEARGILDDGRIAEDLVGFAEGEI